MADRLIERVNADVETLELDAWLFSIADGSISTSVNFVTHFFSILDRFASEVYPSILQIQVDIDSGTDPETGV